MIDTSPGTPGWWLLKLKDRLEARANGRRWNPMVWDGTGRPPLRLLQAHLDGKAPLPGSSVSWDNGMREFLRMARMNYAELIADSPPERMIPVGFRTAADDDRNGDKEAARIYRSNRMSVLMAQTYSDMCALGDGYQIVGAPDPKTGIPRVTANGPCETITYDDPVTGRPKMALNLSMDEWTANQTAHLYLPGMVLVVDLKPGTPLQQASWDDERSGTLPDAFSDVVPVVRFQNRRGVGEFEPHLDVIGRINHAIFQGMTIAAYQAFKQRAVIGAPIKKGDLEGNEDAPDAEELIDYSEVFTGDPGSVWMLPDGVSMWESGAVDLGPIRAGVKDDVQGLAAATKSPLYYLFPDAASGSAEGASAMREGHINKIEDRRRRADDPNSQVLALCFDFMGDASRADPASISTIWQPAERFTLAERYSAAAQAKGIEPLVSIWQNVLQRTPEEIEWMLQLQEAEQMQALLLAPEAPSATGQQTEPGQPAAEPEPAQA